MLRLLLLAALLLTGCGAIASSPPWAGGGMAVTGPRRAAELYDFKPLDRRRAEPRPDRIVASHILVMHVDSKAKAEGVTRTRKQARERAQECLRKLRAGARFADMVAEYSDDPATKERDGDLGAFGRDDMVPAFSDVAFSLQVGEISEVFETPYGFHIVYRSE